MTTGTSKKIRIAVGTADQLVSSVWFFSAYKGCLFLGSVGLGGGTLKATLHESGKSHVRFGPHIKELANTYVTKWDRPTTPPTGAIHIGSIFFPTDFLKGARPIPENVPDLIRLERVPPGRAIELSLFYSRESVADVETKLTKIGLLMTHIRLDSGERVTIVASQRQFDPALLGPMSALAKSDGALSLPPAQWMAEAAKHAESIGNISSIRINEPSSQGNVLRLVEVSGLRIEKNKKSAA